MKHGILRRAATVGISALLACSALPGSFVAQPVSATITHSEDSNYVSIEGFETNDGGFALDNGIHVDIGWESRSVYVVNGDVMMYGGAPSEDPGGYGYEIDNTTVISLYNGSLLIINGNLYMERYTRISCMDGAQVIVTGELYNENNGGSVSQNDLVFTNLHDIAFTPGSSAVPDLFYCDGKAYQYDGCDFYRYFSGNKPHIFQAGLALGSSLGLEFYLKNVTANDASDIVVLMNGKCEEDGQRVSLKPDNATNPTYYYATANNSANHVYEEISATVQCYNAHFDDYETIEEPTTYSIVEFLEKTSQDPAYQQDTVAMKLIEGTLLYGKAAANYFGDANVDISADISDYRLKNGIASETTLANMLSGIEPEFTPEQAKVSVVLNSRAALRIYLPNIAAGTTVGTAPNQLTSKQGPYGVYFEIGNLSPYGMGRTDQLAVKYHFSAYTWVYRVLTDANSTQAEKDMAFGMYAYMRAAEPD